jgi:D-alanine-D-alanine ligase
MKVLILGGGDSPEREVSLRSAKAIAEAARSAGFDVIEKDPKDGLGSLDDLKDTMVFPILHGAGGEDGVLQSELEKRGLPFLGSDSRSSADCFDKLTTRKILEAAGVPMPDGDSVTKATYRNHPLAKSPHVLKVSRGGSSIGTLIVRDPAEVSDQAVDELFGLQPEAVIEQLIEGTEITVPILDKQALPVIEIVPPPDAEFDYENKYNGATQEICPPVSVPRNLQEKAQDLAEKVHSTMGCRHLSRVDIMIDENGNLLVLEINTIPGLTNQSLYPKSAAVAGYPMQDLVEQFVNLVKRDFKL